MSIYDEDGRGRYRMRFACWSCGVKNCSPIMLFALREGIPQGWGRKQRG